LSWEYERYETFEGRKAKEFLSELPFYAAGEKVVLSVEDYEPYGLILLVFEAAGKNAGKLYFGKDVR
jgi:hypothetical protein